MLALIVALPLLAVAGASERTTVEPAAGTFHLAEAQAVGLDDASRPPTALAAVEAGNWAMVRINGDRRALQLIGCGGETVVASYGVTSVPSLRTLLQ